MLILFYITLVWLKIVAGDTLIFFWLWLARDRGVKGVAAGMTYTGALSVWLLPWIAFLWHESRLYLGHCGFRQGLHECGLLEFFWSELTWIRLGFLLDLSLFIGVIVLMMQARVIRNGDLPLQPDGSAPTPGVST